LEEIFCGCLSFRGASQVQNASASLFHRRLLAIASS
jgi:hypothetical protein